MSYFLFFVCMDYGEERDFVGIIKRIHVLKTQMHLQAEPLAFKLCGTDVSALNITFFQFYDISDFYYLVYLELSFQLRRHLMLVVNNFF